MDITYYGHNCFRMIERGMASIITDPFDASFASIDGPHLPADIVTISTNMPGHNGVAEVKGSPMVLNTPGEFEIGGVFITGIATWNPQTDPEHTHYNVAYVCDFDKVRVCHLGTLDYVPSQSVIEALGSVDVLMIPVGGHIALNSTQAAEVISLIEPGLVVPMYFAMPGIPVELDEVHKFLAEMGAPDVEAVDSLRVTTSAVPDSTQIVVIDVKA